MNETRKDNIESTAGPITTISSYKAYRAGNILSIYTTKEGMVMYGVTGGGYNNHEVAEIPSVCIIKKFNP